jgi:cytidylate kinase
MPKTIYIHVGMSKTGTTSIQQMLAKNEDLLSQSGILFPKWARKNGIGHHSLAAYIKQGKDEDDALKLKAEVGSSKHQKVIVSSELFERMSEDKWRALGQFFSPYRVKIIIYLRRQDDAIISMYNDLVKKHALDLTFSDYLIKSPRIDLLDYRKTLGVISTVFGHENLSVGIFSKTHLLEGNVGRDFSARVDPDLLLFDEFTAEHNNSSLIPATAMLMARINRNTDFDVDHSKHYGPACKLAEWVETTVNHSTDIRHNYFASQQQRESFFEQFAESNQVISDLYLNGKQFIQPAINKITANLTTDEEKVLLEHALETLIQRNKEKFGELDGLAKTIGALWLPELRAMIEKP